MQSFSSVLLHNSDVDSSRTVTQGNIVAFKIITSGSAKRAGVDQPLYVIELDAGQRNRVIMSVISALQSGPLGRVNCGFQLLNNTNKGGSTNCVIAQILFL